MCIKLKCGYKNSRSGIRKQVNSITKQKIKVRKQKQKRKAKTEKQ